MIFAAGSVRRSARPIRPAPGDTTGEFRPRPLTDFANTGVTMAGETVITVVGNLTADPELRFTPNGAAVANFTVASTPRTFDRQSNEWKDGETLFLRCSIWREAAENVAESLTKGMRVVAQGALKQRSYEKDGQTRTVYEMDVDEVGPSLKYATAKVTRSQRGGGGGGFGGGQQPGGGSSGGGQQGGGFNDGGFGGGQQSGGWGQPSGGQQSAPAQDPWSGGGAGGGWDTPAGGEPPF